MVSARKILGLLVFCALAWPALAANAPQRVRVIPTKVPPSEGRLPANAAPLVVVSPIRQAEILENVEVVEPMAAMSVAVDADIYSRPVQVPGVMAQELVGAGASSRTMAGRIASLARGATEIDAQTQRTAARLAALGRQNDAAAREYYASVATILAQLQAGTTPGNPRLVAELRSAEAGLEGLSRLLSEYAAISRAAGDLSGRALSLSQETQAALALPGAVEEDHRALLALQDSIAQRMVSIDRLARTVTGDVTRASRYERSERDNLRLLSLAVERGELYGIGPGGVFRDAPAPVTVAAAEVPASAWQPLLKVTFDRPDVAYEAPLHAAVRDALGRQPRARFALVSIYPAPAWEGQKATAPGQAAALDRQAAGMRDSLARMGLAPERVALSSRWGKAPVGEVYLYLVP